MFAASRVCVLIERFAVESGQSPVILRKVRGNPVQNHTDASFVQSIDQVLEVIAVSKPRGWSKVAGHLVSPRWRIRVLRQWHELNVRKTKLLNVWDHLVSQVAVVHRASPRASVQLIHTHRCFQGILFGPSRQPIRVFPDMVRFTNNRSCVGRYLSKSSKRVYFLNPVSGLGQNFELVGRTGMDSRDKNLPNARSTHDSH